MEETTNKSGMSTGMIIGIAVIVAIVFGGGAYAYVNNKAEKEKKDLNAQITELQNQVSSAKTATTTPSTTTTTDETASWKTYSDSTYGYSIKYPTDSTVKDWASKIKEGTGNANDDILSLIGIGKNANFTDYEFSVEVNSDSLERRKLLACYELVTDKTETQVTLAGLTAYKITCKAGGPSDMAPDVKTKGGEQIIRTIVQKGNKVYEVGYNQTDLNKDTSSTYNKILASFQFTK